ncbi:bifunctional mannitol-1-phosphate dehydrogenase/phosphatase [Acinetobacter haemolyticus]|uniref:bifunctional mannitol-1-phosphate dehydrogenase/phosphatase n=1 Tax=Acinetobacter haemolyticus TaxID=29430 RepID=UPI000E1A2A38|nr:HAD family hydrolase [Acinetobacter haemolyticus]RSN77581.1 HAD family hydrolase [Acinetobacter haemolyticus]SUU20469.1 phosphatase/phosphohexomutase [Acinetobacter haemolyticus]
MLIFHDYPVHGAIFDMDGTMFDTERLRFQTLKQASQELIGQEFSDDYLMQCLGLSAKTAEQLAQKIYGTEVPYQTIRKRADELELEFVRNQGVPIKKGLVQVLERLRKSGLRMAVATSSRRAIAEEYLINANVYKFFDLLVCGDEVEKGKPHPEIFLQAAEKINLKPEQCLMFEDSENGIRSAFDAGGITVLFKDIKEPNDAMLAKANFYYPDMYEYLIALDQHIPEMLMPQLQEAFPQSLNQLTVGIHGFGAIGGGYIAQILSHWDGFTRPKRILASTRNRLYREAVNSFGSYSIRYPQCSYDERIENLTVIDADNEQQMLEMYMQSSLIALCLPEQAIESESKIIAKGLLARFMSQDVQNYEPITFLIILNKVCAKYLVLKYIRDALLEITDEDIAEHILSEHYFCDTVVNRMVSKLTDQDLYRQLKIKHRLYQQYQSDLNDETIELSDETALSEKQEQQLTQCLEDMREQFQAGQFLQNMDLILFHGEADMPIYVENRSPLLVKMRQMVLVDQISDIQIIKNRLWNGCHAILAWNASLNGHETIGIAMADPQMQVFVERLVDEVKLGLTNLVPNQAKQLDRMANSFLNSCRYAYKDPCERVARDPLRKLSFNERVFGSIETHIQQQIPYQKLVEGAVFGYIYAIKFLDLDEMKIVQHLQKHVKQLDISESQYKDLLADIYDGITAYLKKDQDVLNLKHFSEIQTETV